MSSKAREGVAPGADDEEWPDDIVEAQVGGAGGDDDMYGDMLESGWIGDLWGIGLLKETESLIASTFLKRDHVERDCAWRDSLLEFIPDENEGEDDEDVDDNDEDAAKKVSRSAAKTIAIKDLNDLWAKRNDGKAIQGNVLAAVSIRFGQPYHNLSAQLVSINESMPVRDRSRKRREAYRAFSLKRVLPHLTRVSIIDMSEVVAYLSYYEMIHEILEIQISRARTLLDDKRSNFATPEHLTELSESLGMTGLTGKMIMPLCVSALEYAGMRHDAPCPIDTLEKYCIGRASRGAGLGGHKQSHIRAMLMTLFKPKQFERDQLRAILMKDNKSLGGLSNISEIAEGSGTELDGYGMSESVEAARARALQSRIKAKHMMVLVKALPKTPSEGLISVAKLKGAMTEQYKHLSKFFIDMLCSIWFRATETHANPETLNRFFFPCAGFTVRVRLPMGGGFRVSGNLRPTDGTAKLYKATIKQMFNKLKTMRAAGADSRVPADVQLFNDEERTQLIPDSIKAYVGNEIDSGTRIYAYSAYVAELMEQMEEDENAALGVSKKGGKGGKCSKGSTSGSDSKKSAPGRKADANAASNPNPSPDSAVPNSQKDESKATKRRMRKSKEKPGTIQEALDKLMTISEPIPVPPMPPFPSLLSEAHTWGIPVMTKYLRDELELPMYEVAFLRSEMTGRKFLEQDQDSIHRAFKMEHSMHSRKIADHASYLRELVFERSSIIRPSKVEDWAPEHVSGWLACKLNCSTCALASFRQGIDGHFLLTVTDATKLVDTFRTVAADDEQIGRALQGLAALVTNMCKVEPLPERPSKKKSDEESQKKLEAKRAEAELLRRQKEEDNFANFSPLLTSLEEVLMKDFCLPIAPPSPREEDIKPTADKVGASVSVAVQPTIGSNEGDSMGSSRMKAKMKKQKQQKETPRDPLEPSVNPEKENDIPQKSYQNVGVSASQQSEPMKEEKAASSANTTPEDGPLVVEVNKTSEETKRIEEITVAPARPIEPPSEVKPVLPPAPVVSEIAAKNEAASVSVSDEKVEASHSSHVELEQKLARLTAVIEAQRLDMHRLEQTAMKLREDGAKSEQRMQQEQELTRQSISQLRQERAISDRQALDHMMSKYTKDMEYSKRALEGVIADLQRQREEQLTKREVNISVSAPAPASSSSPAQTSVSTSVSTSTLQLPIVEVLKPSTDAIASTTSAPALEAPAPTPAVPKGMEDPEQEQKEIDDQAAEEDLPLKEFKSVGRLMGYGSQRALEDASDLVVYGGKKPRSSDDAEVGIESLTSPAKASQDFQALFQQVAATEVNVWKSLLNRYVHHSPSTLMVSETSAQMSRIATLWMRLGCRMLEDMRKGPNDGTTQSASAISKGQILAAAGVDKDIEIEEEDEEGLSVKLTQAMVDGLKGLERCARALLGIDHLGSAPAQKRQLDLGDATVDDSVDPYLGQQRRKLTVQSNEEMTMKEKKLSESLQRKQKREMEAQSMVQARQNSRERQGVVKNSQRKHDYDVAAGMVFCLGLAKRLLDKYPSKADHTHLLYLFTHLREGTLPLKELSRENLRSLMSNILNVTLPSWPQFDSLCQRWDPEGRGFCSAPSIVHALKNVNPLGEGLGPGDYQGVVLLTLSTMEKQLGTLNKRMDAGFLDIIFGAASRIASFDALVGGKKHATNAIETEDFDEWDDWADGDEVTEEEQERRSMKMADEMQLVSDLLLESSRPFFIEDIKTNEFARIHTTKASATGTGGIAATTHSFRRDQPSTSCPLCFIPPNAHTLMHACNLTARGLQIYEGRKEPVLIAVETLATIHMLFRLMVLSRLRDEEEAIETESAEASLAAKRVTSDDKILSKSSLKNRRKSTMRLAVPEILDQIAYVETDLKQLLGDQKAATLIKQANSDNLNIEEVERILLELLGCPLPEHGVLGLYTSQVEVECYIYHKHRARVYKGAGGGVVDGLAVGSGAVAAAEKHKLHYQMALSEISATLAEDLREAEFSVDADDNHVKGKKNIKTTVHVSSSGKRVISSKDLANSHLLEEMNALMHRQRVDQCAVMLDHLNSKAARRKRTLEAALSLLESLKIQIPGAKVVSNVVNPRTLLILSVEEICKRTNDLKRMIEQDISAKPTEAIKQLSKKINGLKIALHGGTIKDEDGALTMILQEIGTLEKHVAQASSDCLELISVILLKAAEHL